MVGLKPVIWNSSSSLHCNALWELKNSRRWLEKASWRFFISKNLIFALLSSCCWLEFSDIENRYLRHQPEIAWQSRGHLASSIFYLSLPRISCALPLDTLPFPKDTRSSLQKLLSFDYHKTNRMANRTLNFEAGNGSWWGLCSHETNLLIGPEPTLHWIHLTHFLLICRKIWLKNDR